MKTLFKRLISALVNVKFKDVQKAVVVAKENTRIPGPYASPAELDKWLGTKGITRPKFPLAYPKKISSQVRSEVRFILHNYWTTCEDGSWTVMSNNIRSGDDKAIINKHALGVSFSVDGALDKHPVAHLIPQGQGAFPEVNQQEAYELCRIKYDIYARRKFNSAWNSYASILLNLFKAGDTKSINAVNTIRPKPPTLEELPYAKN